jgi:uncharacterized membrane protein YdjX (TVP38/TMEM64 family)
MVQMRKLSDWIPYLIIIIFLIFFGLMVVDFYKQYPHLNAENLNLFIASFGAWAVVTFFALYLLCSPVPFIATLLAAASGLLFGVFRGALFSIVSGTLTSLVPFYIARKLGREWVEQKLQGSRMNNLVQRLNRGDGFTFVILLRLVGVLPWELQNYVSGVTRISLPRYFLATILGCTPMTFCLAFLGYSLKSSNPLMIVISGSITLVAFLIPIAIAWFLLRKNDPVEDL